MTNSVSTSHVPVQLHSYAKVVQKNPESDEPIFLIPQKDNAPAQVQRGGVERPDLKTRFKAAVCNAFNLRSETWVTAREQVESYRLINKNTLSDFEKKLKAIYGPTETKKILKQEGLNPKNGDKPLTERKILKIMTKSASSIAENRNLLKNKSNKATEDAIGSFFNRFDYDEGMNYTLISRIKTDEVIFEKFHQIRKLTEILCMNDPKFNTKNFNDEDVDINAKKALSYFLNVDCFRNENNSELSIDAVAIEFKKNNFSQEIYKQALENMKKDSLILDDTLSLSK